MLDCLNVLAHLAKDCFMVFVRRRLLRRNDDTSCRVAHAHAVLLFDPNVVSKLWAEVRFIQVIGGSWDSNVRTFRRKAMSSNLAVN
jgi:hypothetical protein